MGPSYTQAYQEVEPRVIFEAGGNLLRRQRGGQKVLLEQLWPKLKMIVSVDYRMTRPGCTPITSCRPHSTTRSSAQHPVRTPSELRVVRPRRPAGR